MCIYCSNTVDAQFALSLLGADAFAQFNSEKNSDQCLEITDSVRRAVTDSEAGAIIEKISRCGTVTDFQHLEKKQKERYIKKIYEKGVSVRQLSRLTGTSKGLVERYLKTLDEDREPSPVFCQIHRIVLQSTS